MLTQRRQCSPNTLTNRIKTALPEGQNRHQDIMALKDDTMHSKDINGDYLKKPILFSLRGVMEGFFSYNSPKPEQSWMKPEI